MTPTQRWLGKTGNRHFQRCWNEGKRFMVRLWDVRDVRNLQQHPKCVTKGGKKSGVTTESVHVETRSESDSSRHTYAQQ